MFFQQRPAANATLSYFFGCAGHGKAIAVDVVAGRASRGTRVVSRAPGRQRLRRRPLGQAGVHHRFREALQPMLSLDKGEFVRALTADIPPPPADMPAIVAANLSGGTPATAAA